MGRETSDRFGTGQGNLGEFRDWSGDTRGGPGRVGGPTGRSRTGRGTLDKVRDGLGDPRGGPERFKRQ